MRVDVYGVFKEAGLLFHPFTYLVDVMIADLTPILDHREEGHPPRIAERGAGRSWGLNAILRNYSTNHGHHISRLFF